MKQVPGLKPELDTRPSASLLQPLAAWFERARRAMPWRAADLDAPHPDPYGVLVSELMLQQTQVATVIPYYQRWMQRFPDAASLAGADDDEIHRHWQGLGYYRRAGHLRAAAAAITSAGWPADLPGLLALPGLGPYTAAALSAIAFQRPEAALDGNAFRVLARVLGLREDPRRHAPALRQWLRPALEAHGPSRITQAIMELGATRCLPAPQCQECPLQAGCQARALGLTAEIPPRPVRAAPKDVELFLVALQADGRWLLHTPTKGGLLGGLWRWPTVEDVSQDLAAESRVPYGPLPCTTWPGWTQVYSHRREHVLPVSLQLARPVEAPQGLRWVTDQELAALPLGRRDQRLRGLLGQPGSGSLLEPPIERLLTRIL